MTVWFRVPDTDSDPRPDPRVWCLQDPDSDPLVKDGETGSGSGAGAGSGSCFHQEEIRKGFLLIFYEAVSRISALA
jgi:hypothetical protein